MLGRELWQSKFDGLLRLIKEYIVDVWKIRKHKETNLHAYVLGIYRTSFQHNLHCFIDACVHVVNDYIVSN